MDERNRRDKAGAAGRAVRGLKLAFALGLLTAPFVVPTLPATAARAPSPASLVGKVYQGVLTARITPPPGSGIRPTSTHGGATAVLDSTGKGSARFVLTGTLLKDGDASFFAPGQFRGNEWVGQSQSFPLTIGVDGGVQGEGMFDGRKTSFDGTFSGRDLRLLVEMVVPENTAGGFPAGTRFQFLYKLRHMPPASTATGSKGSAGGCREVVYRLKLTPNLFGGGLSSVRVPECRH